METPTLDALLHNIDLSYDRKAWHGPTLRGSLRGVDAALAAWRPAPGRHNIREIAVHAAYWKYTVRRRLLDEPQGSFPLKGSDWFERPDPQDERAWKADLRLLGDTHRTMRSAVAGLDPALLSQTLPGGKVTYLDTILGIAAHDTYHAGQIQLLKRLAHSPP